MFNIKSIYFYFLALQISIVKIVKRIYFSTDYYHKSLKSKIPQQFYYHPNPFLLSTITDFKKFSFKISEIDANTFWIQPKNTKGQKELHNFFWLNLIDRKNDGKSLQKIINLWILKYSKYKRNTWETSVLSKRIISWILNADIILNNEFFDFKRNFLTSIVVQANHLKKNIKFEKDYSKKLEILVALLLTGLVFKEYEDNYEIALKGLENLVKDFFDEDGFPKTRNPSDLIFFTKYLTICKESIKDAQKYMPEFLDDIVNKNLACIKNIQTPNNHLPLFNGGIEEDLKRFDKFIDENEFKTHSTEKNIGGIQKLKFKNSHVFFDIGSPPKKSFSKSYQSGPLSFEYYLDGLKIITNCGFGNKISSKAELLSRLTSAQSSITLNDTSVSKFERNHLINKVFGNSTKNSFKTVKVMFKDDRDTIVSAASHNGYEKNFGCTLSRKISINKSNSNLSGTDEIIKKRDGKPIKFNLRFHLYPGLSAVKTMGGNSVLIQISKNKSLILTVKDESIILEKSLFLGRNVILDNTCITVSGNLVNKNKAIHWEIKKKN